MLLLTKADVTDKIDVTEEVPNDDSDGNTNLGDDIVLSSCTVRDSVLAGGRLSDRNFVVDDGGDVMMVVMVIMMVVLVVLVMMVMVKGVVVVVVV